MNKVNNFIKCLLALFSILSFNENIACLYLNFIGMTAFALLIAYDTIKDKIISIIKQ